ncbi:MAG: hypothetical protein IJF34_05095 [Clostridia bacterium]|nr:hypothetical protein [Clostridia bacterium]MBQ4625435.1 hypothetical protein [Clostridia bacterium]
MKRIVALILVMTFVWLLSACGPVLDMDNIQDEEETVSEEIQQSETEKVSEETEEMVITEELETEGEEGTATEEELETEATKSVFPAEYPRLEMGETAATELTEFTLEKCSFSYYMSGMNDDSCLTPAETPQGLYNSSLGTCYLSLTFTVTNKDRGGSLSFGGSPTMNDWWQVFWCVGYEGKGAMVRGYDLNINEGEQFIDFAHAVIVDRESGKVIRKHDSNNYLLDAGETVTIRTFGVVGFEPNDLNDGFELMVGVRNLEGDDNANLDFFVYNVPSRQ